MAKLLSIKIADGRTEGTRNYDPVSMRFFHLYIMNNPYFHLLGSFFLKSQIVES
jgi:hypothetical protein